jgi:uncharacterized protein (TIGR03067 family)
MTTAMLIGTLPENDTQTDLEKLQGVWTSVDGRRGAELLIAGRHFALRFFDGDVYLGTFDLNPGKDPKTMDMRIAAGPARHQGKLAFCIYEVSGDQLLWCPTEPGSDQRLTAFPPVEHRQYICTVFRRERPRKRG